VVVWARTVRKEELRDMSSPDSNGTIVRALCVGEADPSVRHIISAFSSSRGDQPESDDPTAVKNELDSHISQRPMLEIASAWLNLGSPNLSSNNRFQNASGCCPAKIPAEEKTFNARLTPKRF